MTSDSRPWKDPSAALREPLLTMSRTMENEGTDGYTNFFALGAVVAAISPADRS
jgi:hypothetical protein